MSSHSLTAGCYLTAVVAVLFLYTLVHAQYTASLEEQVADQHGVVTGTVTYRQRIALPRQAVFQVRSKTAGKPGPSAQLENTYWKFLKALEAATSFKLSGEELELYDNDRLLASFELYGSSRKDPKKCKVNAN